MRGCVGIEVKNSAIRDRRMMAPTTIIDKAKGEDDDEGWRTGFKRDVQDDQKRAKSPQNW